MNIRLLTSLALCVVMTGCGWHLRGGKEATANIDALTVVAGNRYGKMVRALDRQMELQHIKDGGPSSLHLHIANENMEGNTLAFSDNNYPATQELVLEVRFSVTNAAGETVIAPNTERVVRVYESDSNRRLAVDREMDLVKQELYEEMAINLLRRIDYIAGQQQ